jgi:hypothetical protein
MAASPAPAVAPAMTSRMGRLSDAVIGGGGGTLGRVTTLSMRWGYVRQTVLVV